MALQTALFFETVEEIYSRIFRYLKPGLDVPAISVQFCEYANANSRIKLSQGHLTVRISDLLRSAPSPVQEALAFILLGKLFRKPPDSSVLTLYQRYLNRSDIQGKLHAARRQRGRKAMSSPQGEYYDLKQLFTHLNAKYFEGALQEPMLGWSMRSSRTVLGHYDPSHHAIVLSKILDSRSAPEMLVEYVLYHEMLHIRYPTTRQGERRRIHTKDFRITERKFENYADARSALREFLARERV